MIIKKIKEVRKKYREMAKRGVDIVPITEISSDLYYLEQELRIATRLRKKDR